MQLPAFITKNSFWIASALYIMLVFCCARLPVFWDMYSQARTANFFLETDFQNLIPNGNTFSDNGHFPIYALYLAALFKIFGFKLWVAHFSVLPFSLGVLFQLKKLSERFLSPTKTFLVLLLTLAHPAVISQTIYFSSEIALVFFSLWMMHAIGKEHASNIAMSSVLLCLFNLRGISLILVLLIYFGFIKKRKTAFYLITGIIFWCAWMLVHYLNTGWFFQNPENIEHRTVIGFSGMLKNLLLCFVKLFDLGSIAGWIIILFALWKNRKSKNMTPVILLLLASLSVFIFSIPLSNPVNSRYFLITYILLLPAFVFSISQLNRKIFIAVTCIFSAILVQSNWITFPNRYGNAWDCSLKSLDYFEVRKEFDEYYRKEFDGSREHAEAGFQLYFNDKFYLMNENDTEYSLLSDTEMPTHELVAESNICNNYNAQREKYIAEKYVLLKRFVNGGVYIELYRRK